MADDARLENAGTFDANGDNVAARDLRPRHDRLVHNTGTFSKSGGTGTSSIYVPFDNDGTVAASAGTLSLGRRRRRNHDRELRAAAAPDRVRGRASPLGFTRRGGTVTTRGEVEIDGAYSARGTGASPWRATCRSRRDRRPHPVRRQAGAGTGTLTVNGAFNWSGGAHTDAGTTVIASTATLTIGAPWFDGRPHAAGRTPAARRPGPSGDIYMATTAGSRTPAPSTPTATRSMTGFFDRTTGLIHNTGTFKERRHRHRTIFIPFDNDGTVKASAGTLSLEGNDGGSTTGDFAGSGTDGLIRFASNSQLESGVTARTIGSRSRPRTLTVSGDVSVPAERPSPSPAAIAGRHRHAHRQGRLQLERRHPDRRRHHGDRLDRHAHDRAPGGAVGVRGGRTFQNNGTATWTSGDIYIDQNGRLENAGTFDATGDNGVGVLRPHDRADPQHRHLQRAAAPPPPRSSSRSTTTAR